MNPASNCCAVPWRAALCCVAPQGRLCPQRGRGGQCASFCRTERLRLQQVLTPRSCAVPQACARGKLAGLPRQVVHPSQQCARLPLLGTLPFCGLPVLVAAAGMAAPSTHPRCHRPPAQSSRSGPAQCPCRTQCIIGQCRLQCAAVGSWAGARPFESAGLAVTPLSK